MINLSRTLSHCCIRICSSATLLQFAVDDLRGIFCHAMNTPRVSLLTTWMMFWTETVTKLRYTTVPKKEFYIVLPYLGLQSKVVAQQLKSSVSMFFVFVSLKVIFRNTCRINSFFHYKDRLSRSLMSKVVYKASCWNCDDFYIGKTKRRLHDRKTEHFKVLTKVFHTSAIADHVSSTGHKLETGKSDTL